MYSFASIVKRIKERLANETSRIEGTFTMDNVQAVSQELAMIHSTEIEPILDAVFLDTATGRDLERRAADWGEERRPAVAATGILVFAGTAKTYIPSGTRATTGSLYFATTEAGRVNADGRAAIPAQCETAGPTGNVPADTITRMAQRMEGVTAVINPVAFEGGVEREEDEALRARVYEKIRFPVTSGNEHYYEYLAKQVPGVGQAKCFGTYYGPGTAKLVVLSGDGDTPDETVLQNVREHVEPQRLIGCALTVAAAQPLVVDFIIRVVMASGYLAEQLEQGIKREIEEYFTAIAFDRETTLLSYHKVIELVFRVKGVADIAQLTINGGMAALPIGAEAFCRMGTVVFSAD